MNHLEKYVFAKLAFGPSDSRFRAGRSDIAGKGLFASVDFESGERLFPLFWYKKGEEFDRRRRQGLPIRWPVDVAWGDLTWYVNHQKAGNCAVVKEGDVWYCVAKKFLPKGTEITFDYRKLPAFGNRNTKGFVEK